MSSAISKLLNFTSMVAVSPVIVGVPIFKAVIW